MAKFLNTSGTNYYLEELIKGAKDRLILISPLANRNWDSRNLSLVFTSTSVMAWIVSYSV